MVVVVVVGSRWSLIAVSDLLYLIATYLQSLKLRCSFLDFHSLASLIMRRRAIAVSDWSYLFVPYSQSLRFHCSLLNSLLKVTSLIKLRRAIAVSDLSLFYASYLYFR